jgi:hypothetical protein
MIKVAEGYRHSVEPYDGEGDFGNLPHEFIQLQDVLSVHLGSTLSIDKSGFSSSPLEGFFHVSCRKYCSC